MSINDVFSKNLKKFRKLQMWTQKDLAEMIGVSPQTVYKYENGIAFPPSDKLELLLKSLDLTPNDLLWDKEKSVLEKIDSLVQDEINFQYKISYFTKLHGVTFAFSMMQDKHKFDKSAEMSREKVVKYHHWHFDEKLKSLVHEYIVNQLEERLSNVDEHVAEAKIARAKSLEEFKKKENPDEYWEEFEEEFGFSDKNIDE